MRHYNQDRMTQKRGFVTVLLQTGHDPFWNKVRILTKLSMFLNSDLASLLSFFFEGNLFISLLDNGTK